MSTETTGPDWGAVTEATLEAVEAARATLDEFARAWEAATPANEKETVTSDDVIEELALELFERSHEPPFSDDAQGLEEARAWARKIATDLLPTREEIARAIADGWNSVTTLNATAQSIGPTAAADAVLALLKGQEA